MKTYQIILSGLMLILILASCQKFVDIQKGNSQFVLTTVNDCQLLLDNYEKMNTGYPCDGEISADNYFLLDVTLKTNATLTAEEKDLYSWLPTAQRTVSAQSWVNPYQTIYNANLALETLEKLKEKSTEDQIAVNALRGAALFYRAYSMWQIAQIYTRPYSVATATQDPGIPIRLSSDINGKSSRGTVQDTYNRIIQDLNEAATLLPNLSSIASRPNKAATYAMLARTYLSMEDYPKALLNAESALQIKGILQNYNGPEVNKSLTSNVPFARYNMEVIFHAVTFKSNILVPGTAGNNIAKVDRALAASYATGDLRKTVFLKANSGIHAGTFRFTGNYEPVNTATLFNGLAVDELYLIRAECYARAGDKDNAMKYLNELLVNRWATGKYVDMTAATPAEALSKVLEERRKELLFRGLRWSDLRRLNKDQNHKRDLERKIDGNGEVLANLPANDPRYTLLIPVEVINNSGIAQNVR